MNYTEARIGFRENSKKQYPKKSPRVKKRHRVKMKRKLVAALACRNQGSRLYGKPLQNLDIEKGIRIIDNIVDL